MGYNDGFVQNNIISKVYLSQIQNINKTLCKNIVLWVIPPKMENGFIFIPIYHQKRYSWFYDPNQERKERNVLFNNAPNTFYLWLYGIRQLW